MKLIKSPDSHDSKQLQRLNSMFNYPHMQNIDLHGFSTNTDVSLNKIFQNSLQNFFKDSCANDVSIEFHTAKITVSEVINYFLQIKAKNFNSPCQSILY
jgi:hypothetical protein